MGNDKIKVMIIAEFFFCITVKINDSCILFLFAFLIVAGFTARNCMNSNVNWKGVMKYFGKNNDW